MRRSWAQESEQRPNFTLVAKELEDRLVVAKTSNLSTGMLPVPATWSPVKDPSLAELFPAGAGAERVAVEADFLLTLAGRGIQVVEVLRVQNKEKGSVFSVFRQSILERYSGRVFRQSILGVLGIQAEYP